MGEISITTETVEKRIQNNSSPKQNSLQQVILKLHLDLRAVIKWNIECRSSNKETNMH